MKNYYQILGVSKFASKEEIRKTYRRLAHEFHPDKNKSTDAQQKFIEITEAYKILIDSEKRDSYDNLFSNSSHEKKEQKHENNYDDIFNRYSRWQREAQSEAQTESKMSFEDFKYKFLDQVVIVYDFAKIVVPILFVILFIVFMYYTGC